MIECSRPEAENGLEYFSEGLSRCSSDGLIFIYRFVESYILAEFHDLIDAIPFAPLIDENVVKRSEAFGLDSDDWRVPDLEEMVGKIRDAIGDTRILTLERYAFRYNTGQSLLPHRDKARHKIVAMCYFGEFLGGEFCFDSNGRKGTVELSAGDVIISVNELPDGRVLNPIHWVREIREGTRFCSAMSYVSEAASVTDSK